MFMIRASKAITISIKQIEIEEKVLGFILCKANSSSHSLQQCTVISLYHE